MACSLIRLQAIFDIFCRNHILRVKLCSKLYFFLIDACKFLPLKYNHQPNEKCFQWANY